MCKNNIAKPLVLQHVQKTIGFTTFATIMLISHLTVDISQNDVAETIDFTTFSKQMLLCY